jgi:predicted nucleic acid-binding protein
MKEMKAADLIWLATARLQREQKDRAGFSPDEILKAALATEPRLGLSVSTIRTHISRHCVANIPPAGTPHRLLTRNPNGTYRLYRHGDKYHPQRVSGQTYPDARAIPSKYKELMEWFHRDYDKRPEPPPARIHSWLSEVWERSSGNNRVAEKSSFVNSVRIGTAPKSKKRARDRCDLPSGGLGEPDLLGHDHLCLVDSTADHFARIRADRSIASADAIQLACAAQARVDLFLTNDRRLARRTIPGIQFIADLSFDYL